MPPSGALPCWAITFAAAILVYGLTTAPGVLWGDHGEAQLRVLLGAWTEARDIVRVHLPYYAMAGTLRRVLDCDAAWAANLTAAIAGAVTVANISCLLRIMVTSRAAWFSGAALLLCSHTLWQLSTRAEVVTFATMCLSFELLMAVRWFKSGAPGWLLLAAFANGLGWSTHNLALLTLPAYAMLAVAYRRALPVPHAKWLLAGTTAWLLGAAPILTLAVQSYLNTGSLTFTARSVFVGQYAHEVFNRQGLGSLIARSAGYIALNFPTPLLALIPLGWWALRRERHAWFFLTSAGVIHLAFAFRYAVPDQYTFFVPSYLFLVLFAGVGTDQVIRRWPIRAAKVMCPILALLAPVVYAALPLAVRRLPAGLVPLPTREVAYRDRYTWFLTPWGHDGSRGARRFGQEVLQALPSDAVLLADPTLRRPVQYIQAQTGVRPDVAILDGSLAVGPVPATAPSIDEAQRLAADGRLFVTGRTAGYAPEWLIRGPFRYRDYGLVWQVLPKPESACDEDSAQRTSSRPR